MSYALEHDETVGESVRRAAREQIDKALGVIDDDGVDARKTVHEVRKRCKKIRGLIRLVRPAFEDTYQEENARHRDAARELSDLRDATSVIECVDALGDRFGGEAEDRLGPVRAALAERRSALEAEEDLGGKLSAFAETLEEGRKATEGWELDEDGFEAIGPGVKKTYKRARKAMRKALEKPKAERFHEWRKRVKYHRYHCKLLRNLWSPLMMDRRDEAKRLSDLLGDAHDLAVLRGMLLDEPDRFGGEGAVSGVVALADARRQELRAWAAPSGRRLFAEKGKRFVKRLGTMHEAWRQESAIGSALPEGSAAVYS